MGGEPRSRHTGATYRVNGVTAAPQRVWKNTSGCGNFVKVLHVHLCTLKNKNYNPRFVNASLRAL